MSQSLHAALRERLSVRKLVSFVALLVVFRVLFEMDWSTIVLVATMAVIFESFDLARVAPNLDERYLLLVLGLLPLGIGVALLWTGENPPLGVLTTAVGAWLLLDTAYNVRNGLHPGDASDDDLSSRDALLLMQVGNLVAEELEDGPKTVDELVDACDMTETRIRDALEFHERAGTAHRDNGRWVLDESHIGPWAFVRDTTRRVGARLLRPLRLFVPS